METVAERVPTERGWKKLIFALLVFFFVPMVPPVQALVPVDQTYILFMPALGACALLGWWAGGRAITAVAWVGVSALAVVSAGTTITPFENLIRGWSLLFASGFGLVSLFAAGRPFFPRAMVALLLTLTLAGLMSLTGRMTLAGVERTAAAEFTRRNTETVQILKADSVELNQLAAKFPSLAIVAQSAAGPAAIDAGIKTLSDIGAAVFPALLSLESLAALALAWATYSRLGGAILGVRLLGLREFRFNDQLVWGLIVGLIIILLPSLANMRGLGRNLVVFFATLYTVRGLGVLAWFLAPGMLTTALAVGLALLLLPVLNVLVVLGFMMLGVTALGLGLGDTWADWRNRIPSPS